MPDEPPLVLKRYHPGVAVDGVALAALVRWRRELAAPDRARVDRLATWPLAVALADDGTTRRAFVMRRVPGCVHRARPAALGAQPDGDRARRSTSWPSPSAFAGCSPTTTSASDRLQVIWMLAETVAFLHRRRIVIGDLSVRNVLCCARPGRILLVDCDSMTLGGVGSPLPTAFTVDWDDPAQPDLAAASADVYKLALFVLRTPARSFQTRDAGAAGHLLDATGRLAPGALAGPQLLHVVRRPRRGSAGRPDDAPQPAPPKETRSTMSDVQARAKILPFYLLSTCRTR